MPQQGSSQNPGSVDADLLQQLRILKGFDATVYRNPLSSYGALRPCNVVMDGDSITKNGYDTGTDGGGGPFARYTVRAWWSYILAALGGQVQVAAVSAVPGQTAQEIVARFESSVLNYWPDEVWAIIGQNNLLDADNGTAAILAIRQYATLCKKWGIKLRLGTVTPRNGASQSAQVRTNLLAINRSIYQLQTEGLCVVFDSYGALVDPASATGASLSNVFYDAMLHPNSFGAVRIAIEFLRVFKADFPPVMRLSGSGDDDSLQVNASSRQCLLNPNLRGTTGSLGTGVTGTVPSSWTASRNSGTNITATVAAVQGELAAPTLLSGAAGGTYTATEQALINSLITQYNALLQAYLGNSYHAGRNWVTYTIGGTSVAATEAVQLQQASVPIANLLVAPVPGQSTVQGQVTIRASGLSSNFRGAELRLEGVDSGGTPTFQATTQECNSVADTTSLYPSQELTWVTPSITVAPNTFRFRYSLLFTYSAGANTGTFSVAQPQININI